MMNRQVHTCKTNPNYKGISKILNDIKDLPNFREKVNEIGSKFCVAKNSLVKIDYF